MAAVRFASLGHPMVGFAVLIIGGLVAVLVALVLQVGRHAAGDAADVYQTLVTLRSYRLVIGAFAGVNLAVAGVLLQGLFRNPLADPGVIGAGAGASLGGLLALLWWPAMASTVTQWIAPELIVAVWSMAGAMAALVLLMIVARRTTSTVTVLLFGIILTLFFAGIAGFVQHLVQEDWQLARALQGFVSGTLGDKGPQHIWLFLPLTVATAVMAWTWAPQLNVLQTGDDEAISLGLSVPTTRRWVFIWSAVAVGASVAVAGNIAFVGLLVPHIIRRLWGGDHRWLLPLAAVGGAVFVLFCDVLAHLPGGAAPLPLGIVTGLLGAPLFLAVLVRRRHEVDQWQ